MAQVKTWDVLIIGGGIIGLSLAIAMRKRGATVLVVERGEPGRESSHAAGGMLVDFFVETPEALQPLATASACMYPEFVHELEIESGMKVDLRDQGTIFFWSGEQFKRLSTLDSEFRNASLSVLDLEEREPALKYGDFDNEQELESFRQGFEGPPSLEDVRDFCKSVWRAAIYIPERSVDPRALTAAALKTAKNRGVDFSSGDEVISVTISDGRASGVTTKKTSFHAAKVANCAGAWSGQITSGQTGMRPLPTRPVKGQMLCLVMPERDLLRHVIRSPEAYLIPRSDGRLLVGATVEEAGFDKRTDPATIQRLHQAALRLVPKLKDARILEDWAGLRPGTPDNLPILGETSTPGYYTATGHFRDGILLAPITAQVMADAIEGRPPQFDLKPFSPLRFENPANAT